MKKANQYYKIAGLAFGSFIALCIVQVFVVLLPIYELAGKQLEGNSSEVMDQLQNLQEKAQIFKWLIISTLLIAIILLALGLIKSYRKKHER